MVDNNKIVRFWNKVAEKLYGWSEGEALGHKVTELWVAIRGRSGMK